MRNRQLRFLVVDDFATTRRIIGKLLREIGFYGEDYQRSLDFAVAASALKHTVFGDFNQVSVAEVEKLAGGDRSGRVSR